MDLSRYLGLFVSEAREHLAAAHEILSHPRGLADRPESVRDLLRHAHSVKGMASSMGYSSMANLAHAVEDLLDSCRDAGTRLDEAHAALVAESLAGLERMVSSAERGAPAEDPLAAELASRVAASRGRREEPAPPAPGPQHGEPAGPPLVRVEIRLAPAAAAQPLEAAMILGRLARLGRIVRSDPPAAALRMGRAGSRLEALVETERSPGDFELELRDAPIVSVRAERVSSAPNTPSPSAPPASWVRVRADLLDAVLERVLELMFEQERLLPPSRASDEREAASRAGRCRALAQELHADVMEMRLIEFESVARRLSRAVHDLARTLEKSVRFEIEGRGVRVDRSMLEALVAPLLHMIRNALDHGIERPDEREARGKEPSGRLRLAVERRAGGILIELADDGRGIDPEALRIEAVKRGLLGPTEAASLGDAESLMLASLPGLSTAAAVTEVSGRGVGLDAARAGIEALGGRLEIRSSPGRGTSMRVSLPLTLAVIRAILVRSRGQIFALPASSVARMISAEDLAASPSAPPVVRLDERLGIGPDPSEPDRARPALLCPAGSRPVALVVDEVLGRRDVVVKPLRPPVGLIEEYSGAALLEDGSVVLVLDPAALVG